MNIEVTAAADRGSTPLALDQKLFRSVFGVVTWYALRLVADHCQSVTHPLKPCTGTFTQAMGLPCAHVCNAKKHLGGLVSDDFDEHWFWNRNNVHRPFRDPQQVRINSRLQNQPQASTGRILSSFETTTSPSARTLPKCSACHQRGHTRTSRHCPIKMQASIAEQSLRLQENELQQASQVSQSLRMPQTPLRTVVRMSSSSADSFHTAPSLSDPFRALETQNQPENGFNQLNTLQEARPKTPQRTFHIPSPTRSLGHYIPSSPDSNIMLTPTHSALALPTMTPTHSAPALPIIPCRGILPLAVPASPLQPFDINCPEMVYERYLQEKVTWLVQHPNVDPEDYRTARGLPVYSPEVLQREVHAMPAPQVYDPGRCGIRWTNEEIYAWGDHHQALEDGLVEVGLAVSHAAGRVVNKRELLHVQAVMLEAQEVGAFEAMRYLN
jgi:hypothetical protein